MIYRLNKLLVYDNARAHGQADKRMHPVANRRRGIGHQNKKAFHVREFPNNNNNVHASV